MQNKPSINYFLPEPVSITEQYWEKGTVPLVSISCSTYNHGQYIREAIEGFLMQKTTFPVEILIHDDASTDGTAKIVREYEGKSHALIYPIYQSENQYSKGIRGIMVRFNFPRARGKYIAMCEGDDYWVDPLKLQKQVEFLENNEEYSACFTNATILNEINNTSSTYVTFLEEGDVHLKEIIKIGGYIFPTASLMFRKESIKKDILEQLLEGLSGDTSLIIAAAMHGKVFFLDRITTVYRRWPNGLYSRVSEDPQLISDWKIKRINGYKKLRKMVGNELSAPIKFKISSESLYILQNSKRFARFFYLLNLTKSDINTLLKGYVKSFRHD